jgi:hypothetical protein
MALVNIIVGVILLILGRKFFWFFVAAIGFYAGLEGATRFVSGTPSWMTYLIAIVVGMVGALVAYFAQKLMIGLAGFLAGAFITSRLVALFSAQFQMSNWNWAIILIGGIIGISLMLGVFEWALIVLSSFMGTVLIINGLNLVSLVAILAGIALFLVGVSVQNDMRRREGSGSR